ncbi:DNA polymerase IV [Yersinia rohdei]|uniref:DNA polymerase IV n=2 Tax=Yersinia rohdei TaxID=29485 RepID=A0A0U1HXY9_YERRO|nr:DNA polymerase IV [Yersinia rohdei]CQI97119.1 DNA polymerase IV [Yersinia rohdei]CQJ58624.1 DNA polymerase IV [Yersinia rohdei]
MRIILNYPHLTVFLYSGLVGGINMRKIIHVDMDCFFAAVEMRDDPSLRDIPIAIGGSRDRRGVISTANYPARRYGVRSAMPTAMALKLCPQLKVIPGRMAAYKEASLHIREIFARYTPLIEPLSLDEAYLDVSDCQVCSGSATLIAQEIRQSIAMELNLTASAGIAPIKFLAKIASDLNKPNGQYVITPDKVLSFLHDLPLSKIPGVGKVTAKRLQELGLITCSDVQNFSQAELLKRFGKFGHVLWERSHGIDEREVSPDRLRKSVGVERTLAEDIHDWQSCESLIEQLYSELETRLRKVRPDLHIARQGVKLKFHDFQQTTQEHAWPELNKADLLHVARAAWNERRAGRGVRLVGLHVTLLDPQLERQLLLSLE